MKRLLIILILLVTAGATVRAQLLEDNDSRLKTKRIVRKNFLFFKSKDAPDRSKGIPSTERKTNPRYSKVSSPFRLNRGVSPRYSSAVARASRYSAKPRYSGSSPFSPKDRKVTPRYSYSNPFRGSQYKVSTRYSSGNPFRGSQYKVNPKYSSGNPFRGSQYKVDTRYSAGSPFRGKDYRISPKYSEGSPFRGKDYRVTPRYSQGSPFRGKDYKVTPRYSSGKPFKAGDYRVNPRYSQGMPFNPKDYKITPRYSVGDPFKGEKFYTTPRYSQGMPFNPKDFKIQPRYSEGMPFRAKDHQVKPRYSAGSPFVGVNYKIRPRFTGTKFSVFRDRDEWGQSKIYQETSMWEGDWKIHHRRIGDQHPSSNYHLAMRFQNPKVRKMFRKWNVYWTRLNGNKQNSNGVNEKVEKPQFDRKERVIWNN